MQAEVCWPAQELFQTPRNVTMINHHEQLWLMQLLSSLLDAFESRKEDSETLEPGRALLTMVCSKSLPAATCDRSLL